LRFAASVEFELDSGVRPGFLDLVHEKPGCSHFDVLIPAGGDAGRFFSMGRDNENRAAFETHQKAAHSYAFDAASRFLVRAKTILGLNVSELGAESREPA
jgi:hypothetical protein